MDNTDSRSDYNHTLRSLQKYGVQGFCTGFLTAAAIDLSENEEQLAVNTATSLRLAMCIGAYIDQNVISVDSLSPVSTLPVRWKQGQFSKAQVKKILRGYSHAYISCITDNTCVTITAQGQDEKKLTKAFKEAGLRAKTVDIDGRFHSAADHTAAAQKLKAFAQSAKDLQFPASSQLKAPLRMNITGEPIAGDVSITDIASAFPTNSPNVITFAFEEGVLPLSLSQRNYTTDGINGANGIHNINGTNGTKGVNGINGELKAKYPPHSAAVVGMSCRFPGTNDVDKFWDLLSSGVSMVQKVPADRLNIHNHRLADHSNTEFWGNFIDDPKSFNHRFFKKSGREAVSWDPEKRVLLEVVYEALESTGHFGPAGENQPNDYGCYIGAVAKNYYDNVACHPPNAYSMLEHRARSLVEELRINLDFRVRL
ncbi:396a7191-6a6b-451c-91a5-509a146bbc9c [Sclerotinia trifoliorum]|uniref:396a7191-6a6b-451c-91a5-509a146bbc9c n=1 Tax=Sclerotinia trifoliorum TaxID=28548 RepID=A0A8H2VVB6_9HELO|nr:396a7191-6a6b-451c-91a5-509a146bbc9c [Sclerotinia trifoliorum]